MNLKSYDCCIVTGKLPDEFNKLTHDYTTTDTMNTSDLKLRNDSNHDEDYSILNRAFEPEHEHGSNRQINDKNRSISLASYFEQANEQQKTFKSRIFRSVRNNSSDLESSDYASSIKSNDDEIANEVFSAQTDETNESKFSGFCWCLALWC